MDGLDGAEVEEDVLDDFCGKVEEGGASRRVWGGCMRHRYLYRRIRSLIGLRGRRHCEGYMEIWRYGSSSLVLISRSTWQEAGK